MSGLKDLLADDPCRNLATDVRATGWEIESFRCVLDKHLQSVCHRLKRCGALLTKDQSAEVDAHCVRVQNIINAIKGK